VKDLHAGSAVGPELTPIATARSREQAITITRRNRQLPCTARPAFQPSNRQKGCPCWPSARAGEAGPERQGRRVVGLADGHVVSRPAPAPALVPVRVPRASSMIAVDWGCRDPTYGPRSWNRAGQAPAKDHDHGVRGRIVALRGRIVTLGCRVVAVGPGRRDTRPTRGGTKPTRGGTRPTRGGTRSGRRATGPGRRATVRAVALRVRAVALRGPGRPV
jgi:hypothetical protein